MGEGRLIFSKLTKDGYGRISSFQLLANNDSYGGRPYIDRIEIRFYSSEDELVNAFNRNEIDSVGSLSPQGLKKLKFRKRLSIEQLKIPRFFAVFLNQNQSKALSDKNVRLALSHATDRAALLKDILEDNGTLVNSPMIGGILDINSSIKSYDYDLELAKKILEETGWTADTDLPAGQAVQVIRTVQKDGRVVFNHEFLEVVVLLGALKGVERLPRIF